VVLEADSHDQPKPYPVIGHFVFPFVTVPESGEWILMGEDFFRVHYGNWNGGLRPQQGIFRTESDKLISLPIRYLIAEEASEEDSRGGHAPSIDQL